VNSSTADFGQVLLPIAFFALFIGIFVLAIVLGARQQKRAKENLQRLATRLGLGLSTPPRRMLFGSSAPEVNGVFRGRSVRVYSYVTGAGKHRTHWSALAVTAPNRKRLTLRISGENFFTRAGRAFGIDDVATGDDAFDRQFYVKSNDAAYVRAALLPELRARLTALWSGGARGTITVEGDEVKYAEIGSFSSEAICNRMATLAELLCDLGEFVEAHAM